MPPIRERELIKPPVGHLLVLFIAVPVVELALLIEIGQRVGTVGTIGLIMGTGIVGASLARQQGISTLARLRADLDAGRWPAEPIVDGVLILVAAAVLITPGVLTDLAGFLCLVPACRRLLKRYLHQRFEGTMRRARCRCPRSLRQRRRAVTALANEERHPAPTDRSRPLTQPSPRTSLPRREAGDSANRGERADRPVPLASAARWRTTGMGWAARGRRRAGVWYDPGLDRADHDRHPSFIRDALGVSTRKVKTTTEELCGRTFSGQQGQPGQTVCCTALRRTGSTRRIRIWCCMYATRNTTRIGPYARDPRWIARLPPAPRLGAASSAVAPWTGSVRTGTPR